MFADPVRLVLLTAEHFLSGGGLIATFTPAKPSFCAALTASSPSSPSFDSSVSSKLHHCVSVLARLLSEARQLTPSTLSSLTAMDWGCLIVGIIVSFRLSFPLPSPWPAMFDYVWARNELRVGEFLDHMCGPDVDLPMTPLSSSSSSAGNKFDVVSASIVIMRACQKKFHTKMKHAIRKEEAVAAAASAAASSITQLDSYMGEAGGEGGGGKAVHACPMLDGSLDQFMTLWDPNLTVGTTSTTGSGATVAGSSAAPGIREATACVDDISAENFRPAKPVVFHDLWATMTRGWASQEED